MARVIGSTKSWLWWLAGSLCALVFNAAARAGEIMVKYGVAPRPPADQPAANEAQKKQAEKLVADCLAPVAAAEPNAEQKPAIEKLIAGLGSKEFREREEASAAVIKQGPAALGALREAAKSKDPEVAGRAATAVGTIELMARQQMVDELKKVPDAARVVLQQQMNDSRAAQGQALQAAGKADAEGNKAEADQLRGEAKTAGERNAAVSGLYRQVFPAIRRPIGDIQALYGVRVPMEEK